MEADEEQLARTGHRIYVDEPAGHRHGAYESPPAATAKDPPADPPAGYIAPAPRILSDEDLGSLTYRVHEARSAFATGATWYLGYMLEKLQEQITRLRGG